MGAMNWPDTPPRGATPHSRPDPGQTDPVFGLRRIESSRSWAKLVVISCVEDKDLECGGQTVRMCPRQMLHARTHRQREDTASPRSSVDHGLEDCRPGRARPKTGLKAITTVSGGNCRLIEPYREGCYGTG